MIETVDFISQREMEQYAVKGGEAIISISDEGSVVLPVFCPYVRLRFYDCSPEIDSLYVPASNFYEHYEGVMTPAQALMARSFIDRLNCDEARYRLIVHCQQGRFRSAAIAQYVHEQSGAELLRSVSTRNEHVYQIMNDPNYVKSSKRD